MGPNEYAAPLAPWERELLGGVGLGIFLHSGESIVQNGVNADSVHYFTQDGIDWLTFKVGNRTFRIPNVRYWTED